MLGSKNAQAIEDMVGYAQETQHEKILRGLAVGIALVMYGRMEEADALIESLCRDKVNCTLLILFSLHSFTFQLSLPFVKHSVASLEIISVPLRIHLLVKLFTRYIRSNRI